MWKIIICLAIASTVMGCEEITNCLNCFNQTRCELCQLGYEGDYCVKEPNQTEIIILSLFSSFLLFGLLIWFVIGMIRFKIDPALWVTINALQLTRTLTLFDVKLTSTLKFFLNKTLAPVMLTYVFDVGI